jgi:23S rRNA (adenine2503-C2)-methyltransferase
MPTPVDILGLTSEQFAQAAALAVGQGSGVAGRLYREAHRDGRFEPERSAPASAPRWRAAFTLGHLRVVKVVEEDGPLGLTAKAVLATHDGYEIECVRIPMRLVPTDGEGEPVQEHTLCLSSQVGCRMACAFCETGKMGLIRHLTAGEIVAQVATVRAVLGWEPKNLVFMGMGEALDNTAALIPALHALTDKRGMMFSHERITVCTSGHAEGIAALKALGWKRLNLSISLNGARDELRSRLMPVNKATPLAELQRILCDFPQRRNFSLGVNWCLMPGINDTRQDAAEIAGFVRPMQRALLNLIPYNPGSYPLTRAPSEDEIEQFIGWLRDEGLAVRRRITKGRSIMAACGQLGNLELRAKRKRELP